MTVEQKERIFELRRLGLTYREIGAAVGYSAGHICNTIQHSSDEIWKASQTAYAVANTRKRFKENPEKFRRYAREKFQRDKQKHYEYVRDYKKKLKEEVYAAYGGHICVCCGETEKSFLQLDHIDNDGAAHRRKTGVGSGFRFYGWLKKNGFPPIVQVLCANCNFGKHLNKGICPHKQN